MRLLRCLHPQRLFRKLFFLVIIVLITGIFIMNLNLRKSPVRTRKPFLKNSRPSANLSNETDGILQHQEKPGQINIDIWTKMCSISINSLRQFPLFPNFPTERRYISVSDSLSYKLTQEFTAMRVMGYIHPPTTGHYLFHLNSPTLAELWFSLSEPQNATKVAHITNNLVLKKPFHVGLQEPVSPKIHLQHGNKYYFEILQVLNDPLTQPGKLVLSWMLPDNLYFTKITGSHVSEYFNVSSTYKTPDFPATAEILPSLQLSDDDDKSVGHLFPLDKQRAEESKNPLFTLKQAHVKETLGAHLELDSHEYNRENASQIPYMESLYSKDLLSMFSKCIYDPKYTKGRVIKRYNGVWNTFFPAIFPNDGSNLANFTEPPRGYIDNIRGNQVLAEKDVLEVVKNFMDQINKKPSGNYSLNSILNIERYNPEAINGEKLLLELVLRHRQDGKLFKLSAFFSRSKKQKDLCFLKNVQWNPKAWINVILNVKKQPGWVLDFVKEMSRILKATRDEYVNFIVADYGNEGIDVAKEMSRHGIKNYQIFKRTGPFYKTSTINMAASKVTDPNGIVLLMDLHLKFPTNFFEVVRKHTIQHRMGFSPMLMRLLQCGRPQTQFMYPHGFYEPNGFGIFAVYKSDWDKFGGMNEKEFKNKWGGEDWEMVDRFLMGGYEIEKLRLPGFYHFDHDKVGMWT